MKADFEVEVTLEMVNGVLAAVSRTDTLRRAWTDTRLCTIASTFPLMPPCQSEDSVCLRSFTAAALPVSPFDDASGNELHGVASRTSDPPCRRCKGVALFICGCFVTRGNGDSKIRLGSREEPELRRQWLASE